jgi:hypothetical protein
MSICKFAYDRKILLIIIILYYKDIIIILSVWIKYIIKIETATSMIFYLFLDKAYEYFVFKFM